MSQRSHKIETIEQSNRFDKYVEEFGAYHTVQAIPRGVIISY